MALSADLYNIKSSGAYTYIIDKSQIDIRMENRMMPLVVGYSDKGVRRMPVVITSKSQFNRVFGNENTKEYDKGNYFHKMAYDLLKNGRFIYAMNLAPINEKLLDLFNTDNGFTPNYGYECEEGDSKFNKIYNSGKPTHIFIFDNDKSNTMKLNGYDLSVSEYYQSPSLNPSAQPIPESIEDPEMKVYEFYKNMYVFDGYFDDIYLKNLYNSGYNKIIDKGSKIVVGELALGGMLSEDNSRPGNQAIHVVSKINSEAGSPVLNVPANTKLTLYALPNGQNMPTTWNELKTRTEKAEKTPTKYTEIESITFSADDNSTITLAVPDEDNTDVITIVGGKTALPEKDVIKLTNVFITGKKNNTPVTNEPEAEVYFKNGQLDGVSFEACTWVEYSDESKSQDFDSKVTFNSVGFYIEPTAPATKVWYNIIGDDKVQIKGSADINNNVGKHQYDLSKSLYITMPFGCTLDVDNDGTQTTFTNKSDFLALGSYSKLQMSTGNECRLYPNPTSTYITKDGIVVEPVEAGNKQAILAVKSTDLKVELSMIGEVDTIQMDSKEDEWVYIKLTGTTKHTFTFGEAEEPFIINNNNDEAASVDPIIRNYTLNGKPASELITKSIVNTNVYCAPLGKTVCLKVKLGEEDSKTSTILAANGIEWNDFKDIIGDSKPAEEWVKKVEALVADGIKWDKAVENNKKREIAQTFYLTGGEKTIETLSMIDGSGFIAKYSGFSIPGFVDAMGVNQEIKEAFNKDVFLHNCLVGTTDIKMNDSYSAVLTDWMESDVFTPLFDSNPIANALIDSEMAQTTAYKLLFGLQTVDETTITSEMNDVIPSLVDAPSCLHTGKNHKMKYGKGGYDYDYKCLNPDSQKASDKIVFDCLTDNPYLTYRYIVDTIIHNGSYINGSERCNKHVGTAITFDTEINTLRETIFHHNLFRVVEKYGKATALVNAPYPIKTKTSGKYNWTKEVLPTEMDGCWRGTYTSSYKMLNYDTNNTSLISCQGHIYPSAGRECELCFQKHENRFPYTPVAGPNFGTIVDDFNTTPAETFKKEDRDILEPLGLNVLLYKENVGTYINSNQTGKQRIQSALSKFHIAELLTYMTIEIQKMMIQLQWEMNTPQIREYLKMKVDNFCETIKNNKGILTYYNVCDSSNNTDEVIDNEMIVIDTGIEPSRAMGKMVNRITVYKTGGIKLSGLV